MPTEILMPALSPTMTEGTLAKWLKKEGDNVKPGEVIAEIETDKATMEVEAVDEGKIGKILVEGGSQNVAVNEPIALLLLDGEDVAALKDYKVKTSDKKAATTQSALQTPAPTIKPEPKPQFTAAPTFSAPLTAPAPSIKTQSLDGRLKISPLAKRIAKEAGVDINQVQGSGPNGRIIKQDVEQALKHGTTGKMLRRNPVEYTAVANSTMRRTIANRLLQSKQYVPHFYLSIDCNIDKLLDVRKDINDAAPKDPSDKVLYKVSVNDMVIKATALALKKIPKANATWTDEAILLYNNVDVSVAVALDGGLITPIIRNADQKPIPTIANEMKELAIRAKQGKLAPEEYQGGGFSISNLGMYGIKQFNAIINPPQSCILAVGSGEKRAIVIDDKITSATIMTVTLSCDHRAVDGAAGAEFLAAFKDFIEKPVTMFI